MYKNIVVVGSFALFLCGIIGSDLAAMKHKPHSADDLRRVAFANLAGAGSAGAGSAGANTQRRRSDGQVGSCWQYNGAVPYLPPLAEDGGDNLSAAKPVRTQDKVVMLREAIDSWFGLDGGHGKELETIRSLLKSPRMAKITINGVTPIIYVLTTYDISNASMRPVLVEFLSCPYVDLLVTDLQGRTAYDILDVYAKLSGDNLIGCKLEEYKQKHGIAE
jgi:hypothetical protein